MAETKPVEAPRHNPKVTIALRNFADLATGKCIEAMNLQATKAVVLNCAA